MCAFINYVFLTMYPWIFQGTFITKSVELKELENHNAPKVFFYGKYKYIFKFKNEQNKILGCFVMEVTLIRPWEKPA